MEDKKTSKNKRRCSFCGRSEDEVGFLITGVNGCICDTCSEQAYEIVQEALHHHGNSSAGNLNLKELPKPKDIKEFLSLPKQPIPEHIKEKYSCKTWIKSFFEVK